MNADPPTDIRLLQVLRSTFGFSSLRPLQDQIIHSILQQRDVFVLMPTGGGKSLCYQLPALLQPGVTVVVSPLIALMKDQVDRLQSLGVAAAFINSSLPPADVSRLQAEVVQGKKKLLYVAPERLMLPGFLRLLSQAHVSLFAIDEAHCISEWGHDFRPDYRGLVRLRDLFPSVPIAAFTATATSRVQADILTQLRLRDVASFRGRLDRPNIQYRVWPKQDAYQRLYAYLSQRRDCSGIIYVQARAGADRLATRLQRDGFRSVAYHAGLEAEERRQRQEEFARNEARIVVATIAFGMGIDKPDIRYVIHYDLPKNLEGYYQESGRAGRDGRPSDAVLFYSYGDAVKQDYFIKQKPSAAERRIAEAQLAQMVKWAEGATCRREALLAYFDDAPIGKAVPCCDICDPDEGEQADYTVPAQMFLSCAKRTGQAFGVAYTIRVLAGSRDQRILGNGHEKLSTYGIGKKWPRQEWRLIAQELRRKGFIRLDAAQFNAVQVTELGDEVLFRGRKFSMAAPGMPSPAPAADAKAAPRPERGVMSDSDRVTLDLFRRGLAPAEIAAERGLALSTIEGHLARAVESGEHVELARLVSDEKRSAIEAAIRRLGQGPLKPLKEALGDAYTYGEIRFVLAGMRGSAS
ncbi:MAG: RecQ family ATP-dependent DNA helicase [Chloroflexi bacterium]|nr:RecQ family ATP-dependent DNA helicase [Chloroflexota bacterium]